MNRVFGGSVFLAILTVGFGAWAQGPMTPSRLNAPTPGSTPWVEPPPVSGTTNAAAVPAAKPDLPAARETEKRPVRRAAQKSRPAGDSAANRLNRQELNRIRSGGGYYRGYSPWAGY